MKCILMNKNVEVMVLEYNEVLKGFDLILDVKNIKYAPLNICNIYINNNDVLYELNKWYKGRGIPKYRDNVSVLLDKLNVSLAEHLLDKHYALSLSDQYWIKPFNSKVNHENINFFENNFDSFNLSEVVFSKNINYDNVSLKSPDNTTDGMLKKSWVLDNNIRYLLKGGYKNDVLQPFNEVLASLICERLGFNHVKYDLDIVNNQIVSKCPCFINIDTEYIPASVILNDFKKDFEIEDYEKYINLLKEFKIKNVREKIENMFILDFIMLNEDRHLNNFGVIRNVNNLDIIDIASIFDTGQSLNIINCGDNEVIINNECKFFYKIETFNKIIGNIKKLNRINFDNLDGVVEEFDNLLHKYQYITKMSDSRINRICIVLNRQISILKNMKG